MSKWSLEELEEIARSVRNPSWQSYRNCGAISREIASALDKRGIPCDVVEGMVAPYERRGLGPEHAWVVVPAEVVEGVSSDVIIDGALDQFCDENKADGRVSLAFAPKGEIASVEVLTRGDKLYSVYNQTST